MKSNKEIDFQFTAIPTKVFYILDLNCKAMLYALLQNSEMYAEKDGYFFRSKEDLANDSGVGERVIIGVIDALYSHNLIDVISVGKGKGKCCNRYKIKTETFLEYEKLSFNDLRNPQHLIRTANYKAKDYTPSYLKKITKVPQSSTQVHTNIDNINNINNLNNINNNNISNNPEYIEPLEPENKKSISIDSSIANKKTKEETTKTDKPMKEIKDLCLDDILKKRTCFMGLDAKIGQLVFYHTNTQCGNLQLKEMERKIIELICKVKDEDATKIVCENLWHSIIETVKRVGFIPSNPIEAAKYRDILNEIEKIGFEIAYVCKRKGIKANAKNVLNEAKLIMCGIDGDYKEAVRQLLRAQIAILTIKDEVPNDYCLYTSDERIHKLLCEYNENIRAEY